MSQRILLAAAVLLLGAGCAAHRSAAVSDLDLARIPPDSMGPVNTHRAAVAAAQDEVARKDLAFQSAGRELRLAEQEVFAAEAEIARAQQASDNATFNRDAAAKERARHDLLAGHARLAAAKAHVRAAETQGDLADALRWEAREQVDLRLAELEWAKYQALLAAGEPAARDVKTAPLLDRLKNERDDVEHATNRTAKLREELRRDQQAYQANLQRYENLRGVGGAGRR